MYGEEHEDVGNRSPDGGDDRRDVGDDQQGGGGRRRRRRRRGRGRSRDNFANGAGPNAPRGNPGDRPASDAPRGDAGQFASDDEHDEDDAIGYGEPESTDTDDREADAGSTPVTGRKPAADVEADDESDDTADLEATDVDDASDEDAEEAESPVPTRKRAKKAVKKTAKKAVKKTVKKTAKKSSKRATGREAAKGSLAPVAESVVSTGSSDKHQVDDDDATELPDVSAFLTKATSPADLDYIPDYDDDE